MTARESITLIEVGNDEQTDDARGLFQEYAEAIGVDLEYQGFAAELRALPFPYQAPHGALFLAQIAGATAGCVALRRLDDHTGEMKRLYVRPAFRASGLGRSLIEAAIEAARAAGYAALRLDTLPTMARAQALYRRLGFVEIGAYNAHHLAGTRFYERRLAP